MPKVSQEHLDRRRRQVLDGARRCFARYGYERATVRKLEKEVGLSRGAIFNYFPTKWELFFALVEEEYERSPESWTEGGFEELLRATAEEDPSWINVHFEFARRLRTDPALRERWAKRLPDGRSRVVESLEEGQRTGEFRDDISTEALRAFLAVVHDGVAHHRAMGETIDIDAVLAFVDDAVRPAAAAVRRKRARSAD